MYREFQRQAEIFKKENYRPAVLVLDNINYLAEADPRRLLVLQAMAKEAADDRLFITVFVTNDEKAPGQLESELSLSHKPLGLYLTGPCRPISLFSHRETARSRGTQLGQTCRDRGC